MTAPPERTEPARAALPGVPGDCPATAAPERFPGPPGTGVEVVVLESRANAKGVREEDALLENGSQSNESDDTSTERGAEPASPLKETSFSIGLQVLFPFLLAGFGTVAAGMVLDIVQVGLVLPWQPAGRAGVWLLAGVKCCQAPRVPHSLLQANIGQMDTPKELWKMITGNMALIQVSRGKGSVDSWGDKNNKYSWDKANFGKCGGFKCLVLLFAVNILCMIMIGVIIGSRKMGINPDNVATPIAASLGDLITLALLSGISWGLYKELESKAYVNPLVCAFFLSLLPIWIIIARRNSATREVLSSGWEPVIIAMAISSVGGLILDRTVSDPNFAGMAVFTPVING
ncbi:S41A1 protein, partial [Prunella himalayana]|nr:S41A1 protein [Prunella himalayana]